MKHRSIYLSLLVLLAAFLLPACSDDDKEPTGITTNEIVPSSAGEGENVVIYGTNFPLDKSQIQVTLNGYTMPIIRSNEEQIMVTVPYILDLGEWPVVVNIDGGEYSPGDLTVTYFTSAPQITEIDPTSARAGEEVVITGVNFPTENSVDITINGIKMEILNITATEITVVMPYIGEFGSWNVILTNTDGRSYSSPYSLTYNGPFEGGMLSRTLSVLAGEGTVGYLDGDGADAMFSLILDRENGRRGGISVGPDGSVYVTDPANQCVRKIATDGTVSTIAGCGPEVPITDWGVSWIHSSDVSALDVQMRPADLKVDKNGNIYILDSYIGGSIRVDANGKAAYFGWNVFTSIALDETNGLAYMSNNGGSVAVKSMNDFGPSAGGAEVIISGYDYAGLAVHPSTGDLYVASPSENKIFKYVKGQWSDRIHIAGSETAGHVDGDAASAQFCYPWGLSFDHLGNLIVAGNGAVNYNSNADQGIRYIDLTSNTVTTFAGSGTAGSEYVSFPVPSYAGYVVGSGTDPEVSSFAGAAGAAVAGDGTVYVMDGGNNRIVKIVTQ